MVCDLTQPQPEGSPLDLAEAPGADAGHASPRAGAVPVHLTPMER